LTEVFEEKIDALNVDLKCFIKAYIESKYDDEDYNNKIDEMESFLIEQMQNGKNIKTEEFYLSKIQNNKKLLLKFDNHNEYMAFIKAYVKYFFKTDNTKKKKTTNRLT